MTGMLQQIHSLFLEFDSRDWRVFGILALWTLSLLTSTIVANVKRKGK